MLGVKLRKTLAIVDGLAHDEHRGEGEMIVVDNLGEVFQLASIDLLVWPCEVITGSHGGVLGILLKQFALDIIHDSGREEDAHRALTLGEQMQLFFLRHRGATFTTSEDNRLTALWNRELTLQLGCCSEKGGDAWGDVIVHAVGVEEGHLLLNGSKDTGITSMEANDVFAFVIELFHQFALFFEGHISRRTYDCSWLVAFCQSLRHQ